MRDAAASKSPLAPDPDDVEGPIGVKAVPAGSRFRDLTIIATAALTLTMLRRAAKALLIVGFVLLGYQPQTAAMGAAMGMEQPCCDECDRTDGPKQGKCQTMGGCVAEPPFTIQGVVPVSTSMSVVVQPVPEQPAVKSADAAPPLRPPLVILA